MKLSRRVNSDSHVLAFRGASPEHLAQVACAFLWGSRQREGGKAERVGVEATDGRLGSGGRRPRGRLYGENVVIGLESPRQ